MFLFVVLLAVTQVSAAIRRPPPCVTGSDCAMPDSDTPEHARDVETYLRRLFNGQDGDATFVTFADDPYCKAMKALDDARDAVNTIRYTFYEFDAERHRRSHDWNTESRWVGLMHWIERVMAMETMLVSLEETLQPMRPLGLLCDAPVAVDVTRYTLRVTDIHLPQFHSEPEPAFPTQPSAEDDDYDYESKDYERKGE